MKTHAALRIIGLTFFLVLWIYFSFVVDGVAFSTPTSTPVFIQILAVTSLPKEPWAVAASLTWGRLVNNCDEKPCLPKMSLVWYSDPLDPPLRSSGPAGTLSPLTSPLVGEEGISGEQIASSPFGLDFRAHRVNSPVYLDRLRLGDGYKYMTQKLLWVWLHAAKFYEAEWYVRVFEDNYVFVRNLYQRLRCFNSSKSVLLGSLERRPLDGGFWAIGGKGWALSRAGLQAFAPHIAKCLRRINELDDEYFQVLAKRSEWCKDPTNRTPFSIWCAEDYWLPLCLEMDADVKLVDWRGDANLGHLSRSSIGCSPEGRPSSIEDVCPQAESLPSIPIVIHSHSGLVHSEIHRMLMDVRNDLHKGLNVCS